MNVIKEKIEVIARNSDLREGEDRRQYELSESFPYYLESRDVTVIRERRTTAERREGKYES